MSAQTDAAQQATDRQPPASPLVSIIINNYNYGRYLETAIDSALEQTYPHREVLVVDDGSTDNSRSIIEGYGDRIIPVLQANGGQAAACNAGFARCQGEICIFLDADDSLLPHIVAQIVAAFERNPRLATVHYRLAVVDANGDPLGMTTPPAADPLPTGDLRAEVLRSGNYLSPPTSGNAFSVRILRQFMPVPEQSFRVATEAYLIPLAALLGPVLSLDDVGGQYRIHGANHWWGGTALDLEHVRRDMLVQRDRYAEIRRFAQLHHIAGPGELAAELSTGLYLASRMISLKLDPRGHPIVGDRLLTLALQSSAIPANPTRSAIRARLLRTLWFWSMIPAPQRLARWLAVRGLQHLRTFQVR